MRGFLLDTVAISEGLKKEPNRAFIKWFDTVDEQATFISVLTVGELQKGIAKLGLHDVRRAVLERWLVFDLLPRFGPRVLPFDIDTARRWGNIVGSALERGIVLSVVDSQIAATASINGLTAITRNERNFVPAGVSTLNPWNT